MEQTKQCFKCFEVKSVSEFNKRSDGRGIYRSHCKSCVKQYNDNNKERRSAYNKQYRVDNKDKISEYRKQYHADNVDKIKQYRDNNRDKINEYYRNRRANDIQFKIAGNLRTRIHAALNGQAKPESTKQLLGIDYDIFIKWLIFQLPPGYTIEDMGTKLQDDHVIPLSSFDLTNEEHLRKAMHWTNHQPLEASKNKQKSDKVNPWLAVCQEAKAKYFLKHWNNSLLI